ncbi:MAG: lysine--tRNA ligase [Parcubacteria group bacterium]|jgi:lysyl-tRNA synthetase class 2
MREDILQTKLEKLEQIKEAGLDPYPEKTKRDFGNGEVLAKFDELLEKEITLVGRVKSLRLMGNVAFAHIEDETGKIQLFLNNKGAENYKLFVNAVEIGDFIQASGKLFITKAGEKSLEVSAWSILSKNIRPIPTEHFGIKDIEEKLRKRYLDLMMNEETRELFHKKNIFWQTIRNFLAGKGFLEVQTPVLEHIPGGADAEPFVTHHNALDADFYLRISLELPLKRLLVGGYEKVFEIGRVFRNEGMDRDHLQEFDHMEFYWAYSDLEKGMEFIEKMYKEIVVKVLGGLEHEYEGEKINWDKKFPIVDYFTEFKKETNIDLNKEITIEELKKKADELKIKYEKGYGKGRMIDTLYKKTVRQKLVQPCFLTGHPLEISPLAKIDPNNPKKVLRFQIVAGRSELCNAFGELNDPIDQRKRFENQMQAREAGDKEAQMMDEDFVESLEYGMPPAFGFGMSERFFSFIMNRSVRETVIFPTVREVTNVEAKAKETKIAMAIVNKGSDMEPWQEMNTIANLNASFAAREGRKILYQDNIFTKDNEKIKLNMQHATIIKQAGSNKEILDLIRSARENKLTAVEFIREMIVTSDDKKIIDSVAGKNADEVEYLGVLIFGKKAAVEEITSKFELYK